MTNSELYAGIAGIVLSLALAYVPKLKDKWAALDGDTKRAVFGGLLVLAAAGTLVNQCAGLAACYTDSWRTFAAALLSALVTSQGTYQLAVKKSEPPA